MSAQRRSAIAIRPTTADDADFILSLAPRFVAFELPKGRRTRDVLTAIHDDIERSLRELPASEHCFISEDRRGQPTGFVRLQLQRDFFSGKRACHVSDLAVVPQHEGEGIGRALLEHAQRWARAHRCKLLTLSVLPANARARALYERVGFVPDLLRMAKPLHK